MMMSLPLLYIMFPRSCYWLLFVNNYGIVYSLLLFCAWLLLLLYYYYLSLISM